MKPRAGLPYFGGCLAVLSALLIGCNKPPQPLAASVDSSSASAVGVNVNVNDVDITTNVKTALLRVPGLEGFDINVITLKGDVRLVGVLDRQAQIDDALKVARAADGVHSIHDELTLKK